MEQPELPGMPPSRQLVGVSYAARVGKDTAADALVRDLQYTKFSFAGELKELALLINPRVLQTPGTQNVNIGHDRLAHIVHMHGWENAKDRIPEVRQQLENIGMAVRKRFGEDFWANLVLERARLHDRAVISDVRFVNEAEAIKALGGKLVKITRPGHSPRQFETELEEWTDWDGELDNSGSIVDLEQAVVAWSKAAFKVTAAA